MTSSVNVDSLIEQIDQAVQKATFIDIFVGGADSPTIEQLYRTNRQFYLSSADSISVPEPQLCGLVTDLVAPLTEYTHPESGGIGNGLYFLKGSSSSPRLPSVEDYAKILVLAAARIGSQRVAELFAGWVMGKGIRARSCTLHKGILTESKLAPVDGMCLETLPGNSAHFPKSLRISAYDTHHQQFGKRAMLSLEFEITSPLPLYDPKVVREQFPPDPHSINRMHPNISLSSFCRAMSLVANNYVDWFINWEDYGDVEAFFLGSGFSSQRREATAPSPATISEEDMGMCLEIHAFLDEFKDLDLAISRWMRSKRSMQAHDQLIELRIALESIFLSDDKGSVGEKRYRLAMRGAWFLGGTSAERKKYFGLFRVFYDYASSVIHAGTPKTKGEHNLQDTIKDVQNLCRDAILRITREKGMPDWTDVALGKNLAS